MTQRSTNVCVKNRSQNYVDMRKILCIRFRKNDSRNEDDTIEWYITTR